MNIVVAQAGLDPTCRTKTLAYALDIDLVVSSLAMRETFAEKEKAVIPIMDARREVNVYVGFMKMVIIVPIVMLPL